MPETFNRFDAADYLRTDADVAAYLEAAAEYNDPAAMVTALGTVARARNVSQLSRDTGLTREGLYKALSGQGNPSFATVAKIANALDFQVTLVPRRRPKLAAPSARTALSAPKNASPAASARRSRVRPNDAKPVRPK